MATLDPTNPYANLDPTGTFLNTGANDAITKAANQEAMSAYYDALAKGATSSDALSWAKFRWQQKLDEAGQTGKWNGQWNNPQEQWFTGQFGQWFGEGGEPTKGAQTLAAQGQANAQANALAGMFGQYYAPGTAPIQGAQTGEQITQNQNVAASQAGLTGTYKGAADTRVDPSGFNYAEPSQKQAYLDAAQGDQTLAAQRWAADASNARYQAWQNAPAQKTQSMLEQEFTQNLRTEQEARAAQAQQQSQAMGYLNLLSNLRGPADWAKYQQVLGSTPGGVRDLVAAAMGQYTPGGGATTGVNPQAASLQSMQAQIGGYDYNGQGGGQLNMPNVYGQNSQGMYQQQGGYYPYSTQQGGDQTGGQMQNPTWQSGQYGTAQAAAYRNSQAGQPGQMPAMQMQGPGTGQTWGSGIGVGQPAPTGQQYQQATGNGTNMWGANQPQYNLPAPNQIASQSWNNMAPSQQQMLLGMYEANGYDKNDVTALYNQSLPKYGSSSTGGAGTWRMS